MFSVAEQAAKYVNAARDGSMVVETAFKMPQNDMKSPGNMIEVPRFDAWSYVENRYALRVLGLRAEFYRNAAKDPTHAKRLLPMLERRGDVAVADNLNYALANYESHTSTQMFKAVETF